MSRRTPKETYEAFVGAVLEQVAARGGGMQQVDYRTPEVAMAELEDDGWLNFQEGDVPRDLSRLKKMSPLALMGEVCAMQEERDQARVAGFRALIRFLFSGGPDPIKVAERAFILARTMARPEVGGMKQWEAGALFGDIRQTWREKERRMVEELIRKYSDIEFTNAGGKCAQARAKQSLARMGNTSKRHGRRKGEERVKPDTNGEVSPHELRRQLAELEREEQRERLAELAGVDPDEIDLACVRPED